MSPVHKHAFTSSAMFNPDGKVQSSVAASGTKGVVIADIKQGMLQSSIRVSADDAGRIASVLQKAALDAKAS
jgi:hypothetical protein